MDTREIVLIKEESVGNTDDVVVVIVDKKDDEVANLRDFLELLFDVCGF